MNIGASPLAGAPAVAAGPGATQSLALTAGAVEFLAADFDGFERLLMCSLFSPMLEFVDQEAALATARAATDVLLAAPAPASEKPAARLDRCAFFRGDFSGREAAS
jgi:[NiFe] hydrogenase assembly HybE family chaperone